MAAWVGYKSSPKRGKPDSWVKRGMTVQECIKEAMTPHPVPANITDFVADLAAMGRGFNLDLKKQ